MGVFLLPGTPPPWPQLVGLGWAPDLRQPIQDLGWGSKLPIRHDNDLVNYSNPIIWGVGTGDKKRGLNSSGRSRTWKNYLKKQDDLDIVRGTHAADGAPEEHRPFRSQTTSILGEPQLFMVPRRLGPVAEVPLALFLWCPDNNALEVRWGRFCSWSPRKDEEHTQASREPDPGGDLSAAYGLLLNLLSCGFLVLSWEEKCKYPQSSSCGDRAMEGVTEAPWAGSGKLGTH